MKKDLSKEDLLVYLRSVEELLLEVDHANRMFELDGDRDVWQSALAELRSQYWTNWAKVFARPEGSTP